MFLVTSQVFKKGESMVDYTERMRETSDVLSNKETVKKLSAALVRMESGECLTKYDMVF